MPIPHPSPRYCAKLAAALSRTYPAARCELEFRTPLQLLVSVILSAQCTDRRVNMVAPGLFRKYPDARSLAEIPQEELEREIRSTGFFRNKARNIRRCCQAIMERFKGEVPATMEELVTLDGVGRKTANVVLNAAFGKNEGVCVDTHVLRLSARLGLSRATTPEGVERDLMGLFPRARWGDVTHWLIWHGRRRCNARKPDCLHCEVRGMCPSFKKLSIPLKKQLPDASKSVREKPSGKSSRGFTSRRRISKTKNLRRK